MPFIEPNKNNLRTCENCDSTYVINGDESEFHCVLNFGYKKEGKCEFCRPNSKYYNK